jgi:adenosine deaminase CECR1
MYPSQDSLIVILTMVLDMRQCIEVKKTYPDLISGYDLVRQQDLGRTLHELTPEPL